MKEKRIWSDVERAEWKALELEKEQAKKQKVQPDRYSIGNYIKNSASSLKILLVVVLGRFALILIDPFRGKCRQLFFVKQKIDNKLFLNFLFEKSRFDIFISIFMSIHIEIYIEIITTTLK